MQKWTMKNSINCDYQDSKYYPYGAELYVPGYYIEKILEIGEIRAWIDDQDIEAFESRNSYTWYFVNESDRMTLLLTWSN